MDPSACSWDKEGETAETARAAQRPPFRALLWKRAGWKLHFQKQWASLLRKINVISFLFPSALARGRMKFWPSSKSHSSILAVVIAVIKYWRWMWQNQYHAGVLWGAHGWSVKCHKSRAGFETLHLLPHYYLNSSLELQEINMKKEGLGTTLEKCLHWP